VTLGKRTAKETGVSRNKSVSPTGYGWAEASNRLKNKAKSVLLDFIQRAGLLI